MIPVFNVTRIRSSDKYLERTFQLTVGINVFQPGVADDMWIGFLLVLEMECFMSRGGHDHV